MRLNKSPPLPYSLVIMANGPLQNSKRRLGTVSARSLVHVPDGPPDPDFVTALGPSPLRPKDSRRVLLFQVFPIWRSVQSDMRLPVGMLYLGNSLRQAGYSVEVFHVRETDVDATLRALSFSEVLFVGVCSVLTGYSLRSAVNFSKRLREVAPDVPIVWGGVQPTAIPEVCLREPYVDYVGMGDGDDLIVEIARMFRGELAREDVAGLAYRDDRGVVVKIPTRALVKDLDRYRPDYGLIDINRYIFDGRVTGLMMTSRGCPFACTFCYNDYFSKRRWRKHSSEFVISTIQNLRKQYKIDIISVSDDLFTVDKKRAAEIIRDLHGIGVRMAAIDIKVNYVDDDQIRLMQRHEVESCFFGLETMNPEFVRRLKKKQDPEQIKWMVQRFRELAPDVQLQTEILMALPFASKPELIADIRAGLALQRLNPNLSMYFGVLFPLPGTEMMNECRQKGFNPRSVDDYVSIDLNNAWNICDQWAGFPVTPKDKEWLRQTEHFSSILASRMRARAIRGASPGDRARRVILNGLFWLGQARVHTGVFIGADADLWVQKNYWNSVAKVENAAWKVKHMATQLAWRVRQALGETSDDRAYLGVARSIRAAGHRRVIVYGAGSAGRAACRQLAAAGLRPLAVADKDRARWGERIEGCPIMSFRDALLLRPDAIVIGSIAHEAAIRRDVEVLLGDIRLPVVGPANATVSEASPSVTERTRNVLGVVRTEALGGMLRLRGQPGHAATAAE